MGGVGVSEQDDPMLTMSTQKATVHLTSTLMHSWSVVLSVIKGQAKP